MVSDCLYVNTAHVTDVLMVSAIFQPGMNEIKDRKPVWMCVRVEKAGPLQHLYSGAAERSCSGFIAHRY